MIIDELIAVLGYDIRGEGELAKFNRGIDQAERNARQASRAINAMGVAIGTFVGNLATQAFVGLGSAIGSLPGDIIATGRTFENLEATLTTIEGSSEKAKASLDWVQDFAKTTPYDLKQVADGFVRLRAYGLDPMSGLLESVGNASSAMGKDLMSGVEAIADAAQGENERLKEFGIRASVEGKKITYSWQQNGQEMTKTVTKNGTEIVKALMEIFGRFDGAMDKQSKTLDGMLSNLGDSWTGFLKDISDRGIYEDVKSRLGGVMETLDGWRKNGNLAWAAQQISDLMSGALRFGTHIGSQLLAIGRGAYYAADGIVSLVSRVTGLDKAISAGLLGGAVLASSKTGRGLLLALARRLPAVAALLAADDIATAFQGGDSVFGDMAGAENMKAISEAASQLAESFRKLKEELSGGVEVNLAGAQQEFINLDSAVQSVAKGIAEIMKAAKQAVDALKEMLFGEDPKSVDNPRAKPGRIEQTGEIVHMDGNRIVDRPDENPTDGFTKEALDYKFLLQNLEGNLQKTTGGRNAAAVTQPMTDNRDQSVSVGGVNVVVNGVANASAAVGAQVGASIGAAVGRAGGTRFEKDDKA